MNKDSKQYRKSILTDPVALLKTIESNPVESKISIVKNLHKTYQLLLEQHKQQQLEVKIISREIGEAKSKQLAFDSLIISMQEKGRQLSQTKQSLKDAEQALYSVFSPDTKTEAGSTAADKLTIETRYKKTATSSNKTITIEPLTNEQSEWNQYVENNPSASIYHHTKWLSLINQCFGHRSHALCAKNHKAKIVGVLPLVRLKSRLFGDFLISMPYFNYGGAIGDSLKIEQQLIDAANKLGATLPVDHIEYRDDVSRTGLPARTDKVNMILKLPTNESELWNTIGSKLRAQIKRPQRESPRIQIGGVELLDDFYTVFARNMRDLGTPVYGKPFFENILKSFPEQSDIIIVYLKNKPVSAGFLLGNKDSLEIPWASTIRSVNHLSMNMLLYWEILKFAIEKNYQYFDFGRSSKNAGTYKFKQQWGAQAKPSYWHYWLAEGVELPSLNPKNPKYALVINIWKKLPIFVTKWLGPHIVKNLP
ncbi:FIG070318: hypothetical protein [hydrothermal vent metagenome]|uniref:BioF2-like acetyltransferase domain-containing protein n=1 Tax=hydrothermal vent metagenome TaxID=652676 RepID=A0A3B0WD19_9ZZZZ